MIPVDVAVQSVQKRNRNSWHRNVTGNVAPLEESRMAKREFEQSPDATIHNPAPVQRNRWWCAFVRPTKSGRDEGQPCFRPIQLHVVVGTCEFNNIRRIERQDPNARVMGLEPQNHFLSYLILRCMSDDKKVILLWHAQHNFCCLISDD